MRRTTVKLLGAIFALAALASCGGGGDEATSTTASAPVAAAALPPADGHLGSGLASQLQAAVNLPCTIFGPGCGSSAGQPYDLLWMRAASSLPEPLTGNAPLQASTVDFAPRKSGDLLTFSFGGNSVGFMPSAFGTQFVVDGTTPRRPTISAGFTRRAQVWIARLPGIAGTDATTPGHICDYTTDAAFVVHEADIDAEGNVQAFAADFMLYCNGTATANRSPVKGAVRYHSKIAPVLQQVFANAGPSVSIGEGRRLVLDGTKSWSPASPIAHAAWTQVSGPALDLGSCNGLTCETYTPVLPGGPAQAVLRLAVQTESGLSGTDDVVIDIQSNAGTKNLAEFWGNGFVAGHGDVSIGPLNGHIETYTKLGTDSIYQDQTLDRAHLGLSGIAPTGELVQAGVTMMNLKGQPLVAGTYTDPGTGWGFEAYPGSASMDITNTLAGSQCGHNVGSTAIGDIDRDPGDYTKIRSLSALVETHCEVMDMVELEGNFTHVWINHVPGIRPAARITGPAGVAAGTTVQLSSLASTSARPVRTRVWRQIGGPLAVASTTPDAATLSIQVPAGTAGAAKLVFALDVIDSAAESDTAIFTLTVN